MSNISSCFLLIFVLLVGISGCHVDRWAGLESTVALQAHCPIERVHVLSFDSHGRYTVQACGHTRTYMRTGAMWNRVYVHR
jgi:hypothetical protein